jgi:hypothetical protein
MAELRSDVCSLKERNFEELWSTNFSEAKSNQNCSGSGRKKRIDKGVPAKDFWKTCGSIKKELDYDSTFKFGSKRVEIRNS